MRQLTEAAKVAALIRKELSAKFPRTKFSVRSENFAGGDAVRVSWDFGPTEARVQEVTFKYKGGSFDSSTDCYSYAPTYGVTDTGKVEEFASAKYITLSREYGTNEQFKELCKQFAAINDYVENDPCSYPVDSHGNKQASCGRNLANLVWSVLKDVDLTGGIKEIHRHPFEKIEKENLRWEEWFYART